IDDMVRADRADQVHIPGAAHAGYLGAEYLRDLHGEGPHTSRSAIDQDLLSRLDLCLIAKALQRGERRDRNGRRLLECDVGGFQHHLVLRGAHILPERARTRSEDGIAWLELRDVL